MLGRLRQGVKRVMKKTVDVLVNFELKNSTQCKILMGIGIAFFIVGYNKYSDFKELETLQHSIDVKALKEILG